MKIGIDISQIVYPGTGVGEYTRSLVENVLKLDKKNDYILFGASLRKKNILDQFANELRSKNLKFETSFWLLPPTFTAEIWNQIHHVKIEKLIGKIDVFHSSDWTQPPTKAKKITTIHDLVIYKYPESSDPKIVATQKSRLKWVQKECDKIIAVSESSKKDIQEILKIPAEKISVIDEAVGEEFGIFASENSTFKNKEIERIKQKYELRKKYILGMSGLGQRKNTDNLIRAFQNLNNPNLQLALIGKINTNVENVKELGFVAHEDLCGLYAGAEVFVYPSLYEGFGLPILEAFSCGIPVVTSQISSLPEVGGLAALYSDPYKVEDISSAIKTVLKLSLVERTKLIKKGFEQEKKFNWQRSARETIEQYEKLV